MNRSYVALGSNLGDREQHIDDALIELALLAHYGTVRCSPFYETDPMGPQNQPAYVNAVCVFDTTLDPFELLAELQRIESIQGRQRGRERWSSRPLDLDLLLYGQRRIVTERLTVPHVGIAERSFVLQPLADLDPGLVIPGVGAVTDLLPRCQQFGIRRLHLRDEKSIHRD